ncbi:MAG: TetR/AcrR family transcriptional regulator [Bacteroidales bacterium]|jgi:AcrR family transcriptional regulator|nr:TetR/AcrR family transcriptional regulator [Bacteroidales bacterium]MDD2571355.1 TetR/AcrR family transcriptional regulator [Bacteroidales bacterium]MDD2813858.1 TetR/AcrR family transcriptional regulator [Bacteroidales bacterium]MDD3385339.1 TetR/AcrR family transcriptional regulator [Bacteroidales bacterium]MDD3811932.1 TetR/AcrR family transcriptional regulator [Bacteroidales bacterium]
MVKFTNQEKENPKLKQLNEAALALFYRYGFRKVTVEEICQEASVSKMTFYKFYSNKMDVARYLVNELIEQGFRDYHDIMIAPGSFEEKVKEIIKMKLEFSGSVSQEFINDFLSSGDPEFTALIAKQSLRNFEQVLQDFTQAQQLGEIRQDLNLQFVFYFLNMMPEMLKDERYKMLFANPHDMIGELVNFFFYGILPRPNQSEDDQ